ncbi:MAG: hypothetical protein WD845_08730 [Pirellulales bacterium]
MSTSLGPWTTAIDSGSTAALSAFWKRRMTQLPELADTSTRLTRRSGLLLALVAMLALGWPTAHLSRQVAAADPQPPADEKPAVAAAEEAPQKPGQLLSIELEGGVTADLIGLCEHPSKDKTWWAADGSPIAAPYQQFHGSVDAAGHTLREIAVRWHVPKDSDIATRWGVAASSGWAGGTPQDAQGNRLRDITAAAAAIPANSNTTTITFSVAAGEWQTMTETNGRYFGSEGKRAGGKRPHGFAYSPAIEHDGQVTITISHDVLNRNLRIIAVDANGKTLADGGGRGGGSNGFMQTTGSFRNLSLKDIHAFQLQARPFHRVEVRNIALNRDQHTLPTIVDLGLDESMK